MNATSWKVFREVRFGLFITEPYVRESGVRRRRKRRSPGTKRVSGWNGFTFRCHDATNVRNREGEGERETIRKAPTRYNLTNIETWSYVSMKMHEHVTWKYKCIMGSAQSKPTNTQHSNKVNTHLKCMKHCYDAHVMQCMKFKTQWSNIQPKNCTKNSLILKKTQSLSKIPKVRSENKRHHCHPHRLPCNAICRNVA